MTGIRKLASFGYSNINTTGTSTTVVITCKASLMGLSLSSSVLTKAQSTPQIAMIKIAAVIFVIPSLLSAMPYIQYNSRFVSLVSYLLVIFYTQQGQASLLFCP